MRWVRPLSFWFLITTLLLVLSLSASTAQAGGLSVAPTSGLAGTVFQFNGTGFAPGETVALWINNPDLSVTGQGNTRADSSGNVSFSESPGGSGHYTQVAHGLSSKYEVVAGFDVNSPGAPSGGGGSSGGCSSGFFSAGGFAPGETAATWTTRPDNVSIALPNASADSTGTVTFPLIPQPGWPAGPYTVVASGYTSHYQAVNTLFFDGISVSGGGCNGSAAAAAPVPGTVVTPSNIVDPMGPGVYLNTDPSALYYFDCNYKWRPMSGTVYFLVLGFRPYEKVNVWYTVFFIIQQAFYTITNADANGNVSLSFNNAGHPSGHYHWIFSADSATYCGHYDLP